MKKLKDLSKLATLIMVAFFLLPMSSCNGDDEDPVIETRIVEKSVSTYPLTINMKQKVNGTDLQLNTTNKPYTNSLNQSFNVSRLRYLISDVTFHMENGNSFVIDGYHFVDIANPATFTYTPSTKVPAGTYNKISFKFGFDRIDNAQNYPELNSVSWGWPSGIAGTPNLGGGYHFMQLEGMYDSSATVAKRFLTHMGTARSIVGTDTTFEDNHFVAYPTITPITVDGNLEFDLVMNVEQWYQNPYEWDFNVYNIMIMPNYNAQRKLNLNGPSVFTIEQ